jgi:rod shape-determining protein MreD
MLEFSLQAATVLLRPTMPILLLLLSTYAAAVLQTTIAPVMEVRGAMPDFFALVAVVWLLVAGGPRGFVAAALVGLAHDLTAAGPLGVGLGLFAVIGLAICWLKDHIDARFLPLQLLVTAAAIAAIAACEAAIARLGGQTSLGWSTIAVRAAIVGAYTAGVSLPVFMVLSWRREIRPAAIRTS